MQFLVKTKVLHLYFKNPSLMYLTLVLQVDDEVDTPFNAVRVRDAHIPHDI